MKTTFELLSEVKFSIGDIVYHHAVEDREPGLMTGITLTSSGIKYYVTWSGRDEKCHYDFEWSLEYDYIGVVVGNGGVAPQQSGV